jgi:hypothetical protein
MTVRITLTDDLLPPSNDFIDFVHQWISRIPFDGSPWAEQGRSGVRRRSLSEPTDVLQKMDAVVADDEGLRHVSRAYELLVALLVGDTAALRPLHEKFRFVLVVGIPRSGGKYLTKQLFRALGHDPRDVPEVLGHDAFPDAGPWRFGETLGGGKRNGWTSSLQTMAEYLTMVEIFFGDETPRGETIVVPKKSTKAVYAAGLFRSAFGEPTESVVTVRHPAPACVSTCETGGGLPSDGRFAIRGNIEWFCARELIDLGFTRSEITEMDYFDAYLHYWENYHVRLAMSINSLARTSTVVPYGADSYTGQARVFADRFGESDCWIEPFNVKDRRALRPDWLERAQQPMQRVAAQWERVGLEFPADGVGEAW